MVDAVGTTAYSYDNVGQLLSEGGLWPDDTVSYTYNNQLRTELNLLQPNASAWSQSYSYDSARRLTSITSPAGTFGYNYDPAKELEMLKLTLSNLSLIHISRTQRIEHRLLYQIRCRTNIESFRDFQDSPRRVTAGDAHGKILTANP